MSLRAYKDAIERFNKLLGERSDSEEPSLEIRMDMQLAYLKASGFDIDAIDSLNIIHVAGSKGKGSTCAYIESILRHDGYSTGLLTSPHLVNIEERIRINGEPVDRDIFAENFWALNDKFEENKNYYNEYCDPTFLSYVLHLALRIFITQKVDVAILEVGLGGEYDHTNFIRRPLVTAVSTIELEHTDILGDTFQEIAWSKSGIFKTNVPAVVARNQQDEVMNVFIERAHSVKCPLYVAPSLENIELRGSDLKNWHLLEQKVDEVPIREKNICLALAIISLWQSERSRLSAGFDNPIRSLHIEALSVTPTERQITGVLSAKVVGRFQEMNISENVSFYLDCAHTVESIKHCTQWFQSVIRSSKLDQSSLYKILLFTVTGTRDPLPLLKILETLNFDAVYFVSYFGGPLKRNPKKQPNSSQCIIQWRRLNCSTPCHELTNENFADFITKIQKWDGISALCLTSGDVLVKKVKIFVAGSVYLVGDVLKVLGQPLKWT